MAPSAAGLGTTTAEAAEGGRGASAPTGAEGGAWHRRGLEVGRRHQQGLDAVRWAETEVHP